MKQILLISEEKIKSVSNLDNNVFGKWLLPAIREAQDINLQSIIGSALYNQILTLVDSGDIALEEYELYKDLLDNQIADFLVYQSLVNVIPLINVNMANMGTVVSNDEHIQTLSQGNIDLVRGYYQNLADIYQKRLQDYLKCHCEYFPELNECGCGSCGIKPNLNSNTNTSGIWLGGLRNPQRVRGTSNCCGGSTKSSSTDCQEEYNKGYRDGERHQKSLLSSTAFTRNGEYEREDGWNSINVNVAQTGHTDEELEDAYQSGYTSGETHQKSLLVSTAVTANGTYEREDGYSSINVNVVPNLETKYASYDNNGRFVIKPSTGYDGLKEVNLNISVAQTGHTDQEITDAYNSGKTDQKSLLIATAVTANGIYSREDGYSSITVNVPASGVAFHQLTIDFTYSERISGLTNNVIVTVSGASGSTNYTYTGGTITVDLLPGMDYTISYNRVDNYTKPSDTIVTTQWGGETTIYPIYTYNESGDFSKDYLTFEIVSGGTLVFSTNATPYIGNTPISININNSGWEDYTNFDASLEVNAGDVVKVRGNNTQYGTINNNYRYGSSVSGSTCYYNLYGNIMSLCYGGDFSGKTSFPSGSTNTFSDLFSESKVLNVSNLILPATTLVEGCYRHLFYHCRNLINTPALPATVLAEDCYEAMFQGCSMLSSVPSNYLPVTTLADGCYAHMFFACTGLTSAPELPATTLAEDCYEGMFCNCSGLTSAPALPATTLANRCYYAMFERCTSLTSAPELPATTLATYCYNLMFQGCTNLNYIKCLATDISASGCTLSWVNSVAPTGTFVKAKGMNDWLIDSDNGIPIGWTIIDYDYLQMPLTFDIISGGNITYIVDNDNQAKTIQYSKNNGEWTNITSSKNGTNIPVEAGDTLRFRGNVDTVSDNYGCGRLTGTKCNIYGNVMSLLNSTNFSGMTSTLGIGTFQHLFKELGVVDASNLILPATTLTNSCYYHMFISCMYLIAPPALPATNLAEYCYQGMFELCSNLPTAPELNATTLVEGCYMYMFKLCTSLNYIKCMATNIYQSIIPTDALFSWVGGLSEVNGTFVKSSSTNWVGERSDPGPGYGQDGVPLNDLQKWTIINA